MDDHLLVTRRLCLRADIFFVPAGSDPVTSEALRNALMISGLLRVKIFRAEDVTDGGVAGTTWCKPSRDEGTRLDLTARGRMDDDADRTYRRVSRAAHQEREPGGRHWRNGPGPGYPGCGRAGQRNC